MAFYVPIGCPRVSLKNNKCVDRQPEFHYMTQMCYTFVNIKTNKHRGEYRYTSDIRHVYHDNS